MSTSLRAARQFSEAPHCCIIDLERRSGNVFLEVFNARGSWNGQDHRRAPQQPLKGQLRRRNVPLFGGAFKRAASSRNVTCRQRKPRNEPEIFPLAIIYNIVRGAIHNAVSILNADNGNDRARVLDLRHADLRQSDVLDLALRLQLLERAELILGRKFLINTMELENVNSFKAQAAQTSFASSTQVFRPCIRHPFIRSGAIEACLCRNHQACRVWVQSFSNDFFAHRRPVRVGRINEINSEIDGPPQYSNGFAMVFGFSPDSLASDSHCAKPEPVNGEIAGDLELAGLGRRKTSPFSFS